MALFVKKPSTESVKPLFTLHANKTVVIVGLGNPGDEYAGTRHNTGFMCVDAFAEKNEFDPWMAKKDLNCQLASKTLGENRVILIKPQTYMNLSGEAVQAVMHFYKVGIDHVVAIYDELDINFGQIRIRTGGGAAGHNGVKSLIQHIGEDFGRVRVGIGPKVPEQIDSADFVLQKFSSDQQSDLKPLTTEVNAILTEYIYGTQTLPQETRTFLV